ncbi:MAG: ParM/StbA family protein [Bacteroidota bacterium]|nr:ParM/StbA family protein [Bacteroidota bacterium]
MEKSVIIPSVFEENTMEFSKIAENFVDGIRIVNFNDKEYVVGNLALREGVAPHKLINSSAEDIDYQLLALTGLVTSTMGTFTKLVVTAGFPYTTFQSYRKNAERFYLGRHEVCFDARTFGRNEVEKMDFTVDQVDIITEIDGCIKAIRNSGENDNFFIASIGFGTFETALSTPSGIVHRTTYSTKGISYAVDLTESELQKEHYLNLLTDQQMERAFQRGSIVANRQRLDLTDLRTKSLRTYYSEVISPALRKKFTDEDFVNTEKIYLVGGGALYSELVEMFKIEFGSILDVKVFPNPHLCAAKGFCLNSMQKAKSIADVEKRERIAYVGIDLGNSNTAIVVNTLEQ